MNSDRWFYTLYNRPDYCVEVLIYYFNEDVEEFYFETAYFDITNVWRSYLLDKEYKDVYAWKFLYPPTDSPNNYEIIIVNGVVTRMRKE